MAHLVEAGVDRAILNRRPTALPVTALLRQLSVHVQQTIGACALMQIVDVLRAEEEAVG